MAYTAIFGGTFNPFHIGHYQIMEYLQNDPLIEKILIIPDRIPPHKTCDFLADDETRIEMCKIVANDFDKAEVCLIEFEREGKSYTYDTILCLKDRFPNTDFAFVIGGDMLVYFDKWYKYKELMNLISFIAFKRSDTDIKEFDMCCQKLIKDGMKLIVKNEDIADISSSEIRKNFKNSKNLLPKSVYGFLSMRGEYSD